MLYSLWALHFIPFTQTSNLHAPPCCRHSISPRNCPDPGIKGQPFCRPSHLVPLVMSGLGNRGGCSSSNRGPWVSQLTSDATYPSLEEWPVKPRSNPPTGIEDYQTKPVLPDFHHFYTLRWPHLDPHSPASPMLSRGLMSGKMVQSSMEDHWSGGPL